jgi:hypothetical protein
VKNVLDIIHDIPGLIANIIFNLNNPEDDDETVLVHHIMLIGTMC